MGLRIYLTLIFLLISFKSTSLFADYNYEEDKKKQVSNLKDDIFQLQNLLEHNENIMDAYNNELKGYNDTIALIADVIKLAQNENNSIEPDDLLLEQLQLYETGDKLNTLKEGFKQRVIWLYKHGANYETEILFTSKSLTDFYSRLRYLNTISRLRRNDFKKIQSDKFMVEEKRKILSLKARERVQYISSKEENQRTLSEKKLLVENTIANLNSENENLNRQMEKKRKELTELQNKVNLLKDNFTYKIDQKVTYAGLPFSELKGQLIFPVNSIYIIEDFGNSINPNTLTVTYNNGIDVSIAKGSEVKAIAAGTVEAVGLIPSFGNVIVIDHGEGFKTLYAVTYDVSVEEGEKVEAGQVIAKTYENQNGQSFHFEMWRYGSPIDPKDWLKRGYQF